MSKGALWSFKIPVRRSHCGEGGQDAATHSSHDTGRYDWVLFGESYTEGIGADDQSATRSCEMLSIDLCDQRGLAAKMMDVTWGRVASSFVTVLGCPGVNSIQ